MCARLCATNAQKKLESCRSEVGNLPRPRLPVRFVGLDNAADVLAVEHVLGAVVDVVQRVSLVTISSILSSPDLYRPTSFGVATCELSPPKMLPFNVFCNIVNRNGLSLSSTSVIVPMPVTTQVPVLAVSVMGRVTGLGGYRCGGNPNFSKSEVSKKATTCETPPGRTSRTCS